MSTKRVTKGRGFRVFTCAWCGYRMRFGREVCGGCYKKAPFYNRYWPWIAALVLIVIAGLVSLIPATA